MIRGIQSLLSFSAAQLAGGAGTATTASASIAADGTVIAGTDALEASQAVFPVGAIVDSVIPGLSLSILAYAVVSAVQECQG